MTSPIDQGEALAALAARVEAAGFMANDPPALALGREVLLACGKGYVSPLKGWMNPVLSVDAAMLLVPEGWMQFDVDATAPELGIDWTLYRRKDSVKATAATPALALCAAALLALREHIQTNMEGER